MRPGRSVGWASEGEGGDAGAQVGRQARELVDRVAHLAEGLRGGRGRGGQAADVDRDVAGAGRRLGHAAGHLVGGGRLLLDRRGDRRLVVVDLAMIVAIWPIAATAPVVSAWIASTRRAMSSVARAVSSASSLTSPATTAKPLPASPARAASIVAFSASRFVCSAMLVIILTTLPICWDESPSRATWSLADSAADVA